MTHAQFVALVAYRLRLTKKSAGALVEVVFQEVAAAVRDGERLSVPGFGVFKMRSRAAREVLDPQTGKRISLPVTRVVGFRAAKGLRGLR